MKKCIICKETKELSFYYKHSKCKDGHMTKCKECQKENSRINRSSEKDLIRYKSNPRKRLNTIYHGMKRRCEDKNNKRYHRYGGRGISLEWKTFEEFYNDMVESYKTHWSDNGANGSRNTSLDRIDNNGNYSKQNCRRATQKEQAQNRG